jgi:UDP-3-O-[3-hydroxymyristoyl] glucosamine N-acyltransferase
VIVGRRCVIHSNAVLGSDGFGYARTDSGEWYRIPQTGTVVLEDEVDVGACSAIDRAALGETRIKRGTKLDNLVHIGHGCQIGPDNLICAQAGLAGSTTTGNQVILAGQVGAAGHLEIGDGVIATAQTGIPGSVEPGRHISGSPAVDHKVWLKTSAAFSRLPDLTRSVRDLERRVESIETNLKR